MSKINYIYEGYFNGTEQDSDELINDIEASSSSKINFSDTVFKTAIQLYVQRTKLYHVMSKFNFLKYFSAINRVFDNFYCLDINDDISVSVEIPDGYTTAITKDVRLTSTTEEVMNTFHETIEQFCEKFRANVNDNTHIGVQLVFSVPFLFRKRDIDFNKFVSDFKRLGSALVPLMNSLSAICDGGYSYRSYEPKILFKWTVNGQEFEHGEQTSIPFEMWRYKGYNVFYNKLFGKTEELFPREDKEKSKAGSKEVKGSWMINNLFRICHRLQFLPENEKEYNYKYFGYIDGGTGAEKKIYIALQPTDHKHNVLSLMAKWIVDNICNKMSYADLLALVGNRTSVTVTIFVSCYTNDKPIFDLNKTGKADKVSSSQTINELQYIVWDIVFLDSNFSRWNQKRKAMFSKQAEDAIQCKYVYEDDLKEGIYGPRQKCLPTDYYLKKTEEMKK